MNAIIKQTQKRIANLQEDRGLNLPDDYSVGNAMNAAYLKLQQTKDKNHNPVLTVCKKATVANALLDMVIQGLNPAKDQCYFVAYGKTLVMMRSYLGTVAAAKRFADIKDVVARVIYKDDVFDYKIIKGNVKIEKHEQSFKNRKQDKAIGAYVVISFNDSRPDYVEMMDLDEIENAWSQGQIFKKGRKQANIPHAKFKTEMMKKTVTARGCKKYINSSNDNSLYSESFNRADVVQVEEETHAEIEDQANSEDFEEAVEEKKQAYEEPIDTTDEVAASGYNDNTEDNKFIEEAKEFAEKQSRDFEKEKTEKPKTDNQHFIKAIKEIKEKVPDEDFENLKEKYKVEEAAEIIAKEAQISFYNELRKLKTEAYK